MNCHAAPDRFTLISIVLCGSVLVDLHSHDVHRANISDEFGKPAYSGVSECIVSYTLKHTKIMQ